MAAVALEAEQDRLGAGGQLVQLAEHQTPTPNTHPPQPVVSLRFGGGW